MLSSSRRRERPSSSKGGSPNSPNVSWTMSSKRRVEPPMKGKAFCPGHITGFFQIMEHKDPLRSGSRGAGLCVSLGATSTVMMEEGNGEVIVTINGKEEKAPVTVAAV